MCGICGFVTKKSVNYDQMNKMRDTLSHRGPDDYGSKLTESNGYRIGFAHRRLSILDLSPSGNQPMEAPDGTMIVFNGEIYNYLELREELRDYSFHSNTDTEVVLAAYIKWGINFVSRLNGMFAIAIFDERKNILHLIRDRMGQKPLYYAWSGNELIFASELKAIVAYPNMDLRLNKAVIQRYLVKQCIASPETIYESVFKVKPGEIISVQLMDVLRIKRHEYWSVNKKYEVLKNTYTGSFDEAKTVLMQNLKKSIQYRLIADVPIGILLSGGYDSTVVAAIAQMNRSDKIKTYSIGMMDGSLDEAGYAKRIANYIGTDHHELYLNTDDMFRMLESVVEYYDEPFADSSQIATMLVSKLASQDVKVVLTGDGGDELFGGYPKYRDERIAQFFDPVGVLIKALDQGKTKSIYKKLPFYVKVIAANRDKATKTQFNYIAKAHIASMMLKADLDYIKSNYDETSIPEHSWEIKNMLLDTITYLPDDLHCKVDRGAMMFSLEARSPFMDKDVVELALSMPQNYKIDRKAEKKVLKSLAWDLVPRELLDRPKQGFSVPVDSWIRNELKDELLSYANEDYIRKQGIFDPKATSKIIRDFIVEGDRSGRGQKINTVIWSFLIFQKWYTRWVAQ